MNYRLQIEQQQNTDSLKKHSLDYKTEENSSLRTLKQLREELQRTNLLIVERERQLENITDRKNAFEAKIDAVRDKHDMLKEELSSLPQETAPRPTVNQASKERPELKEVIERMQAKLRSDAQYANVVQTKMKMAVKFNSKQI